MTPREELNLEFTNLFDGWEKNEEKLDPAKQNSYDYVQRQNFYNEYYKDNDYTIAIPWELALERGAAAAMENREEGQSKWMALLEFGISGHVTVRRLIDRFYGWRGKGISEGTLLPHPTISGTPSEESGIRYQPTLSRMNVMNSYDKQFENIEGFPGDQPAADAINLAANNGFNLGQIKGGINFKDGGGETYDFSRQLNIIQRGLKTGRFSFEDFLIFASNPDNTNPKLARIFSSTFNRPPDPQPTKYSLEGLLSQNKLRDKAGVNGNTVFADLYLNNSPDPFVGSKFSEGLVGNVSVKNLQEPNKQGEKVFDIKDDAIYYNMETVDRGFSQNINSFNLNYTLEPAVDYANDVPDPVNKVFNAIESQTFPFLFETENKKNKEICYLQATLNSFNESFSPNWSPKSFFGRTENIYIYSNTERAIDIGFSIIASEMRQLQNVYERVNWLAQQTYAGYEGQLRMNNGPIIRITIGDIIVRLPGYIRSLSYDWNLGGPGGRWEITPELRMPQMVQVSMSYQVIHENLPSRDSDMYPGLTPKMNQPGNSDYDLIGTNNKNSYIKNTIKQPV